MTITQAQKNVAEQHQWNAARASESQVRLVAGPGTGKTGTIEKRVAHLLTNGVPADCLFVISFTKATCVELKNRIIQYCSSRPCSADALNVRVSTMHSLALGILRRANLLRAYPSTPVLLNNWEQKHIYDLELAASIGCTPSRATEIRLAHDAQWQTLDPQTISQARITQAEIQNFNAFHVQRTNLYSCVLPGEVIFKCVDALRQGVLRPQSLPIITHLIVDEYQDLNECDQEFIRLICQNNTILFVAGDDDQSIYSFRHANPDGIVHFDTAYPQSGSYELTECFRCAPVILDTATRLIRHNNPHRLKKTITSLYANANPPVQGQVSVWQFSNPQQEAQAIAQSCRELIQNGMAGRENQIIIIISNRRLQLQIIMNEFQVLGIPYDCSDGSGFHNDSEVFRTASSLLRVLKDITSGDSDYPAYRDLLSLLSGVGVTTAKGIGDLCITNNQNFRSLFHLAAPLTWLDRRKANAVQRIIACVQRISSWGNDRHISR